MRKTTEAGIDVSKAVLDVAVRRDGRRLETARFDNDAAGHKLVGVAHEGGAARRASSWSRRAPTVSTSRSRCTARAGSR